MPCPYFLPREPQKDTGWAVPPRSPLGALCSGECHAGPVPTQADHELCNFGYARGVCEKFPADAAVDAVRFQLVSDTINPEFGGRTTQILYVRERAHHPHSHGLLKYKLDRLEDSGDPILAAQSAAYLRSIR